MLISGLMASYWQLIGFISFTAGVAALRCTTPVLCPGFPMKPMKTMRIRPSLPRDSEIFRGRFLQMRIFPFVSAWKHHDFGVHSTPQPQQFDPNILSLRRRDLILAIPVEICGIVCRALWGMNVRYPQRSRNPMGFQPCPMNFMIHFNRFSIHRGLKWAPFAGLTHRAKLHLASLFRNSSAVWSCDI